MTIIETTVKSVLKGDRISFYKDNDPRKVLATYPQDGTPDGQRSRAIVYDEAGAPIVRKREDTTVFVHFSDGPAQRVVWGMAAADKVILQTDFAGDRPRTASVLANPAVRMNAEMLRELARTATEVAQELENYGADR